MTHGSDATITGPVETIATKPRLRAWVALATAIVATVLVVVGFYTGIDAALDGNGAGASLSTVVFFVGLALELAAGALAVVTLVRDGRRLVPIIAIAVSLIPVMCLVLLRLSA